MARLRLYTFLVAEDADSDFAVLDTDGEIIGDHAVEYPDAKEAVDVFERVKKAVNA